jgi:hypothetical protein
MDKVELEEDKAVCPEDNSVCCNAFSDQDLRDHRIPTRQDWHFSWSKLPRSQSSESRGILFHKIGIVEKECSESGYWLEICDEAELGNVEQRKWLLRESRELLAIFTSIGRSTKSNRTNA